MALSTLNYRGYTAKIFNISQNKDITDYIDDCNISLPKTNTISSIEARFSLDEKVIENKNEIKIEILDEIGNILYKIQGMANINRRNKSYKNTEKWDYTIRDNFDEIFQKNINESITYYDLYLCNTQDTNNSLLHIISKNLGFNKFDFQDVVYENGEHIRVPFVYFEENKRWVDKLQAFIEATNGFLYVNDKKLFFKTRNLVLSDTLELNRTNVITNVEEVYKEVKNNGYKVIYDRFKKLDNQAVFNLSSKIILEPNTNKDTEVPTMKINYITSSVANPIITTATAYYFTEADNVNSKVEINLEKDKHYVIESFTETSAEIKFYNPLNYKLYIDNFEIKGIPLVLYKDNEVKALLPGTPKEKENLIISNKNSLIQTRKQAMFIAKKLLNKEIYNNKLYNFNTYFLHTIELGGVYSLNLQDINTVVEINSIDISLKPSKFTMKIGAVEVKNKLAHSVVKTKMSANPNTQFIDLTNVENKIEDNKKEIEKSNIEKQKEIDIINKKILSNLHTGETEPTKSLKEYDIWHKKSTNEFKQWLNGKWTPVAESDLLPAIKHFNSLENAKLNIAKANERAGIFLINNDEKFGSINGTIAEVSLDKKGAIRLKNANNLLEWNVKDPINSKKMKSKFYMGVTDVNKIPDDVYFKVGDEATGFSIELKEGKSKATIDGKDIKDKFKDTDKNMNNLASANNENKRILESKIDNTKNEINKNINSSKSELKKYTDNSINSAKKSINSSVGKIKAGLESKINDNKQNFNSKIAEIENAGNVHTFKVGGEANKYYPVWIRCGIYKMANLIIYRNFDEEAPYEWNNSNIHHGSLRLQINTDFSSKWSGNYSDPIITNFNETYATVASNLETTILPGMFIWLRGGDAVYHVYVDEPKQNKVLHFHVYNNGFDAVEDYFKNEKYRKYNFTFNPGTYEECGSAESIKNKYTKERITEIDRKFTNADGKLTRLQQNYEETVQDVSNFKTQTADAIDTVEGALQDGNFVITGNTSFDGAARFVSRGTNEVITIQNGSIDFHRDGQKLTRIKNIRYGSISTDSKGKGIVNFDGFKQPMIVMTSIKSANFGKNMASVFCYPEHIQNCQYRFYVGGTNEHYTEAKPVKVMGTSWSASNVLISNLLEFGGELNGEGKEFKLQSFSSDRNQYHEYKKHDSRIISTPKIKIEIFRIDNDVKYKLVSKDYDVKFRFKGAHDHNGWYGFGIAYYYMEAIDFKTQLNLIKKYSNRTNVTFQLKVTILESEFKVKRYWTYFRETHSHGDTYKYYYSAKFEGVLKKINLSDIKNLFISASAETSTISSATGYGEVSYIAMEVD